MKIVDFMSFSPDWFLTLPGILITGGVVLLLIALVILLTSNKKGDKSEKTGEFDVADTAGIPEPQVNTAAPVQDDSLNTLGAPATGLNDVVNTPAVDFSAPAEPVETQAPVQQEPIDFTAMTAPQPAEPTEPVEAPAEPEQPVVTFDAPAPAVEEKPVVSVYGGVSPMDTVKPAEPVAPVAPVIYGGADPLENTAPIPKVESHTLYNQPEATVVEPATPEVVPSPAAVVDNQSPVVPDLSASTFGPASAPEPTPVEQPTIQTTVTPAAPEPTQTPIVKEEVETLDF